MASHDLVKNRKAFHDYDILDSFEAGIVLQGTEVKSLKSHHGSLQDSYVLLQDNELWLLNCSIPPYSHGSIYNHKERRERKLLMNRREIDKLKKKTEQKGMAIIPLVIYEKKGLIKVKIALAKGRKSFDKRQKLKEKQDQRQLQRAMKKSV
jgi:SsrA-binding protein